MRKWSRWARRCWLAKDEESQKKDKEAEEEDEQMLATNEENQEKDEELARLRAQVAPAEGVPEVGVKTVKAGWRRVN